MKLKKQFALVITMLLLPLAASADDSGSCGDNVTYTYVEATQTLTISGTGDMRDYSSGAPWYSYRSSIKTVVIEDGVTSIGEDAFAECSGLTSLTIPKSVTSIGIGAFGGCIDLTSIVVESGNVVYDSRGNCNAIIKTTINELIAGCKNTAIPNSVTSIGSYAFWNCSDLTSVTIPNSVTSIGEGAFQGCSGLTSVTIPNSVTSIGEGAFFECSGLTSVTIPNSVTSIGDYAFGFCSGLTSVTIPNSVTSIGDFAFRYCSSLTSVTIPESVTSIGNEAFYMCSKLTSVTIPNSVKSIRGGAFNGCSSLSSVTIPESVTSIGSSAFSGTGWYKKQAYGLLYLDNWLFGYKGTKPSGGVVIKEGTKGIAGGAFYECSGLTSVTIPSSVTSIGDYAFGVCSGLTSVTIPNSVMSIGNYAFVGCSSLKSITIPNSVMSIGSNAFSYTGWYNNQPDGPLYLDKWILGNKGASPNGEVGIKEGTKGIAGEAFYGCNSLTSVTIPNSMTSIGENIFCYCDALTSIIVDIGNTVFDSRDNCNAIIETATNKLITGCQNTVIPNSITSIGNFAFEGCIGLTSVSIPNSVRSIREKAFYECTQLTEVQSMIKKPFAINTNVFKSIPADATLYVPAGAKAKYEATEGWKNFTNIVEMDGPAAIEGDLKGDNEIDVTDVVELIDMVLAGIYDAAGDINGDGEVDVTDVVELIDMVLSGD